MSHNFTVVAIIAAFNEEDVIGQVIGHLIEQGVQVYLLDHNSSDDTVAEAAKYLNRGLIRIERFPEESGFPVEDRSRFAWRSILKRKEILARELDGDWFIHHDADEFRESPWADLSLRDAVGRVDADGFNAIDFQVFNFPPTHDAFRRGDDVRLSFRFYEAPRQFDRLQVKCWKKLGPVDLVRSGGHDAMFEGRIVSPARFILRHYPIRSQSHGTRKVFSERKSRFVADEREDGWHKQYNEIYDGERFVRDAAGLTEYDPGQVRVQLGLERIEASLPARNIERGYSDDETAGDRQPNDAQPQALRALRQEVTTLRQQIAAFQAERAALRERCESLQREANLRSEVIAAYRQEAAQRRGDIQALQEALAARDLEIDRLKERLATLVR